MIHPNGQGPMMPQGPNPSPSEQRIYRGNLFVVGDADNRALVVDVGPFLQIVVPMPGDVSSTIGRALVAPGVHVPGPGEMPG